MKKKTLILSVLIPLVIAACAPAQPAVDSELAEPMEAEMEDLPQESDSESMEESEVEEAVAEDTAPETQTVSFATDVWPIIEEYALNAHGGKGGIFLENYDDIVAQVVPGDPENSLLYKVLIGDGAPQMPPGNPLPDEMIQTIYDWIEQGAQNN